MVYNVTIWVYSRCYFSLKVFDNVDIGPVLKKRHDGQFRRRHIWSLFSVLLPFLYKSSIPYVRGISKSGYGITSVYGEPSSSREGG